MNIQTVQAVSISTTTARSTALTVGFKYVLAADADCYVVQGGSAIDATLTTAMFLNKGVLVSVAPNSGNNYVAAITASGTGKLTITRQDNE